MEDQKHLEPKEISKAKHKKQQFIFADLSDQEQDPKTPETKQKPLCKTLPQQIINFTSLA